MFFSTYNMFSNMKKLFKKTFWQKPLTITISYLVMDHNKASKKVLTLAVGPKNGSYWFNKKQIKIIQSLLLFASASMQEVGPFKTGLLAAHPENRGDAHHQHHQIFD